MDLLRHLETFVRLADSTSFSRAARQTGLSVAVVSRQLKALEAHYGVELVRRTTRAFDLTAAGREVLERARRALAEIDDIAAAAREGDGATGDVVVSVPVSFGSLLSREEVPGLLHAHPELRLDLRLEDRRIDLLAEGVDVALRAGSLPPDRTSLVARRLAALDRVLCASPELIARVGMPTSLTELLARPCLLHNAARTRTRWRLHDRGDTAELQVVGRMSSTSLLTLLDAAIAGVGVALLPAWLVADPLRSGRLVRVLPMVVGDPIDVFAIYPRASATTRRVRIVVAWLAAAVQRICGGSDIGPGPSRMAHG